MKHIYEICPHLEMEHFCCIQINMAKYRSHSTHGHNKTILREIICKNDLKASKTDFFFLITTNSIKKGHFETGGGETQSNQKPHLHEETLKQDGYRNREGS